MRCWAEGLDLAAAWQRLMPPHDPPPPRALRAQVAAWRARLVDEARARGRADLAALLRRDPDAVVAPATQTPTLDEFRAAQPDDFYSEAELQALYLDTHGRPRRGDAGRRRQRLRARLLAALQWLERQPAAAGPQPQDRLAQWLDERVVRHLRQAGLERLQDLVHRRVRLGARWHEGLPAIGPVKARRLEAWLQGHGLLWQATPGQGKPSATGQEAASPASSARFEATVRAPIGRLPRLDDPDPPDAFGTVAEAVAANDAAAAGQRPASPPADELAALRTWLAQWPVGGHTWRAYRREAERWWLWATCGQGRALSTMGPADCQAYLRFLQTPDPAWCAPRHVPREDARWRPLERGLAPASLHTAQKILSSLCAWLVRHGHWDLNPWQTGAARAAGAALTPTPTPAPAPMATATPTAWGLGPWWQGRAASPAQRRGRLVLLLAHGLGLRVSELAQARLGWLSWCPGGHAAAAPGLRPSPQAWGWHLVLPGPHPAPRVLALNDPLRAALADHLADRGHRRLAGRLLADGGPGRTWPEPDLPLVGSWRGQGTLSAVQVRAIVRQALHAGLEASSRADIAPATATGAPWAHQPSARQLRRARGVHLLAQGLAAADVRRALGMRSRSALSGLWPLPPAAGMPHAPTPVALAPPRAA